MGILYEIRNLRVGYKPDKVVLEIEHLDLPKGEVIFILGASGVGKSTLLETLGLMNDTFVEGDTDKSLLFFPNNNTSKNVSISSLWSKKEQKRSDIRSNYMSFIFQRSFLLPNLTAGENMMLKSLYMGVDQIVVKQKIHRLMRTLDLSEDLFDRSVYELSGGQQQRVAFIQAFVSSYEVLFADEPTGNLDPTTAELLMATLVDHIHDQMKTCIVVSHDVKLAKQFGDRICVLSPNRDSENIGQLKSENQFERDNDLWSNKDKKNIDILDAVQKIYGL